MVKGSKLWWAIIITLIIAIIINIIPFIFIQQTSSYFAYVGAAVSAINHVITGFSAGLGFYLAKMLIESKI